MLENPYFVYILESLHEHPHYYVGFTEDLPNRLTDHNHGKDAHTAKYRPWRVKTYVAFGNREQALDFERYLKTQSGRAFARKRLYVVVSASHRLRALPFGFAQGRPQIRFRVRLRQATFLSLSRSRQEHYGQEWRDARNVMRLLGPQRVETWNPMPARPRPT